MLVQARPRPAQVPPKTISRRVQNYFTTTSYPFKLRPYPFKTSSRLVHDPFTTRPKLIHDSNTKTACAIADLLLPKVVGDSSFLTARARLPPGGRQLTTQTQTTQFAVTIITSLTSFRVQIIMIVIFPQVVWRRGGRVHTPNVGVSLRVRSPTGLLGLP